MSSPHKCNPIRTYTDAEKSSYVVEAVQLGNHKQYCRDKNIPYSTTGTNNSKQAQIKRIHQSVRKTYVIVCLLTAQRKNQLSNGGTFNGRHIEWVDIFVINQYV